MYSPDLVSRNRLMIDRAVPSQVIRLNLRYDPSAALSAFPSATALAEGSANHPQAEANESAANSYPKGGARGGCAGQRQRASASPAESLSLEGDRSESPPRRCLREEDHLLHAKPLKSPHSPRRLWSDSERDPRRQLGHGWAMGSNLPPLRG